MNQQSPLIPKEVEAHFRETKESERLSGTHGELERLRTLEILARALPPAPAVIFDIGGAAGAYAFPLSEQGHVVHLIDPVEIHLEEAKARSAVSGSTLGSITKGDVRGLVLHPTAPMQFFCWAPCIILLNVRIV